MNKGNKASITIHKKGRIKRNGISLEKHEEATILFLLEHGHNVELIPPSNAPGQHRPDINMDGVVWEMKASFGKSRRTLETRIGEATRQSGNIIMDLRQSRLDQKESEKIIRRKFKQSSLCKKIKMIMKNGETIDLKK